MSCCRRGQRQESLPPRGRSGSRVAAFLFASAVDVIIAACASDTVAGEGDADDALAAAEHAAAPSFADEYAAAPRSIHIVRGSHKIVRRWADHARPICIISWYQETAGRWADHARPIRIISWY